MWIEIASFSYTKAGADKYLLSIDQGLLLALMFGEPVGIANFIKGLQSIPEGATVYIIPATMVHEIDNVIMFDGQAITNMIRALPCKKVFQFDTMIGLGDLSLATCCDEIQVGDYAAVSITKASDGERIMKYMTKAYRHLVKSTYHYWIDKGLFTHDEVTGIMTSEADFSILLLSKEIRKRLKGRD